jgi:hypothetical protein
VIERAVEDEVLDVLLARLAEIPQYQFERQVDEDDAPYRTAAIFMKDSRDLQSPPLRSRPENTPSPSGRTARPRGDDAVRMNSADCIIVSRGETLDGDDEKPPRRSGTIHVGAVFGYFHMFRLRPSR